MVQTKDRSIRTVSATNDIRPPPRKSSEHHRVLCSSSRGCATGITRSSVKELESSSLYKAFFFLASTQPKEEYIPRYSNGLQQTFRFFFFLSILEVKRVKEHPPRQTAQMAFISSVKMETEVR